MKLIIIGSFMNKKILCICIFFIAITYSFSYHIDDYILFSEAKNLYENKNFEQATYKFKALERAYPSSSLVKSNYYAYFLALSYFKSQDFDSSKFYMEKAVYVPINDNGKNLFSLDRNYYLGYFAIQNNDIKSAKKNLEQIIKNIHSPLGQIYQNYAFKNLISMDKKYYYFYQAVKQNNFTGLNFLTSNEIIEIINYFILKKSYKNARTAAEILYNSDINNEVFLGVYLKTLYLQNHFNEVLSISNRMLKHSAYPEIFYYRGKAFAMLNNYEKGIEEIKKSINLSIQTVEKSYLLDARETLFNSYFKLKKYNEVIKLAKNSLNLNINEEKILIFSYFRSGMYEEAFSSASLFMEKYPFSYQSNYLYMLLKALNFKVDSSTKKNLDNFINMPTISFASIMSNTLISNMNFYNIDFKKINENSEIEKLKKIALLKDVVLLNLGIENSEILISSLVTRAYVYTKLYEIGGFYKQAYENSLQNQKDFFKYTNLSILLYPKYYKAEVELASSKYDVPEALIYTSILVGSKFNPTFDDIHGKIGLMQIPYSGNSFEESLNLIEPSKNIDIGTKLLASLILKNKSKIKGLIEYFYGEEILSELNFNDFDFDLEQISDPKIKENLSKLIFTYMFYTKIYNN